MPTDKPDSVSGQAHRQSFLYMVRYRATLAIYPHAQRAASMRAYLMLLPIEVTAFHRNLIRSSLWPYSSPYNLLLNLSADGR